MSNPARGEFRSLHHGYLIRFFQDGEVRRVSKSLPEEDSAWRQELWARETLRAHGLHIAPPVTVSGVGSGLVTLTMPHCESNATSMQTASEFERTQLAQALAMMHSKCAGAETVPTKQSEPARVAMEAAVETTGLSATDREALLLRLERSLQTAPKTLIHRDLTDSNIFFTPDGVQLIDWEVATLGHPDQDLARLSLSLTASQNASFRTAYRNALDASQWNVERQSAQHEAIMLALHFAEMVLYFEEFEPLSLDGLDDSRRKLEFWASAALHG